MDEEEADAIDTLFDEENFKDTDEESDEKKGGDVGDPEMGQQVEVKES